MTVTLAIIESAPARTKQELLARIKAAVVRIGMDGTRQGFKFAEAMFRDYPELRSA